MLDWYLPYNDLYAIVMHALNWERRSRRCSLSFRGVTSIVPPGFYLRLYPLGVPRVVS